MSQFIKKYDLEQRTAEFGLSILRFAKQLPTSALFQTILIQLIHAATSVGANYAEANGASSKKDFKNKIHIDSKF
jgi:four helix bundle protein